MRLLILVEDYCTEENKSLAYVHSRNIGYGTFSNDIEVTVLSFRAPKGYYIDGIRVISYTEYKINYIDEKFDLMVSHAPNLKHHVRFILFHGKRFNKIVFFFHGHEVLKISSYYPKPYGYMPQSSRIYTIVRDIYDILKLFVMKHIITILSQKVWMVFVSQWMKDEFIFNVKLKREFVDSKSEIIYNSINPLFEGRSYDQSLEKNGDFITIRSNVDGSKYGIDIVIKIAEKNPDKKFHIIGKGQFFFHNIIPQNVSFELKHLKPAEIMDVLDRYHYALMPSRLDAQGVMACEMATYGIPLITSSIKVFREVFEGFENVFYIENQGSLEIDIDNENIEEVIQSNKPKRFSTENTIKKEVELFKNLVRNQHEVK